MDEKDAVVLFKKQVRKLMTEIRKLLKGCRSMPNQLIADTMLDKILYENEDEPDRQLDNPTGFDEYVLTGSNYEFYSYLTGSFNHMIGSFVHVFEDLDEPVVNGEVRNDFLDELKSGLKAALAKMEVYVKS